MSVFFGIFLGMGLLFVVLLMDTVWSMVDSYDWPARTAVIEQVGFDSGSSGDEQPYRFTVRYSYEVAGRAYRSEQYMLDDSGTDDFTSVQRSINRYPIGSQTQAYVDPQDPTNAILEHQTPWMAALVLLPLVFVLIGGGGLCYTWFGKDADDKPISDGATSSLSKSTSKTTGIVVGFVLLAGGIVGSYYFAVQPTMRWVAAQSWPATPAVVEVSRVLSKSDDDGTTYKVDILYRYDIAGQTYRSNNYDFSFGSSSGRRGKQQIVNQHPVGSSITAYINPNDPTDATVDRAYHWLMLLGLIPVAVAALGLVAFVRSLRVGRAVATSAGLLATPSGDEGEGWPSYLPESKAVDVSGGKGDAFELKPQSSRWVKCLVLAGVALFWNGIVIGVGSSMWHDMSGGIEWVPMIFILIFAGVGLVIIGAAGHAFLALFNPRVTLHTGRPFWAPGQTVEMTWDIKGSSSRISELTIKLVGTEKATYQRGTDTVTDTHEFFNETLDTVDQLSLRSNGELAIAIPPGAMHSFEASNNKIIWELQVRGDIKRWPDVSDDYPLTIVPQGLIGQAHTAGMEANR